MPGLGTLVNVVAVLLGSAVGVFFGGLIPEKIRRTAMAACGLAVTALGLQMAIDPRVEASTMAWSGPLPYHPNPLVVIGGLVLGGILGELVGIEDRLERFGQRLQALAARAGRGTAGRAAAERQPHDLVEGFVAASLLYCVGAMAVLGSIQDAQGRPEVLYVKALLDGITAIVLASTLGAGVALSALAVGVYQGLITLAAGGLGPHLTLPVLATLTSTGGLLIAAIGLDVTGIKRLPVGNLLPGVFVAAGLAACFG
jgi:uncharacterized protein